MSNLEAIIPVTCVGIHMLPTTDVISKEMLLIVDKPMIQYIVHEIVAVGIKGIVLVSHYSSDNSVENHSDMFYELEALLSPYVRQQWLSAIHPTSPLGVSIMNVLQAQPLGLDYSIRSTRPVASDNPFVVIPPVVVLDDTSTDPLCDNLAMVVHPNKIGRSQVRVNNRGSLKWL
ncbi:hypothetical protein CV016_09170 [Yersinia kristensenii]|uniref:UTP--glucose-1-phosphate uridylyltransferase n=1 Tax=Yersinia kristensenii TaxID=28152 RepID=A0A0T9KWB7_YERKR|nr:hypothetical protein CBW52_09010 [Yersinia kristensenii]PJG63177.1 hypothetical protein CV016_09170 [Yersinia kristensenii]CNE35980.1 UTP-glucose-1-phosphate uridylyltransferase [Yersinia kristensenii]